jgi:hypothetical protein
MTMFDLEELKAWEEALKRLEARKALKSRGKSVRELADA